MTKETIYLNLPLLTAEELKQIPVICDEHSMEVFCQNRTQFEQGTFNEKFPFLFYNTHFKMFQCTFIKHGSKTEISFSEFEEILADTNNKTMKTESTYGAITVGTGTLNEHKIEIVDFIQAKYKDNRLVSMSQLEDKSFVVAVENPESSGRNTQATIWLSKESVIAMLSTCMMYFTAKEENINELLKESTEGNLINYSFSDNLKPINLD